MADIFQQARDVGEKMKAEGHSFEGRINVYACTPPMMAGSTMKGGCGYWIVTVDREAGVTPMFVKCGHCGGTASSRMYKVGAGLEPTHEWFRPASADELPEGYSVASVADHLSNGGLLLRPIDGAKWIAPTPEIRAFIREEQARLGTLLRRA
jgi:hypothetical protein